MKANAESFPPLIVVDWGSTNFRAQLVKNGEVIAKPISHPDGIRHRAGREFDKILGEHCDAWRRDFPGVRVLMSGMIGSREGWQEVGYAQAPAGIEDLARGCVAVPSRHFDEVRLIPGVRFDEAESGTTDVMRGEETQVMGALASGRLGDSEVLCLPGTHSKWVSCRNGKIEQFRTYLTGEVFDRLSRDSLIAGDGEARVDLDSPAFGRGLALAGSDTGLLHHLFLGRTEMLTGRVSPGALPSFVSGLLVGHEIRDATRFARGAIRVIGSNPAAEATAHALHLSGIAVEKLSEDVHLAGVLAIDRIRHP